MGEPRHSRHAGRRLAAYDLGVTTDKVTGAADPLGHEYHIMYGLFLIPVLKNAGRATKMLEIGLGCAMKYGPGASALLWRKLLPNTELWEADIDERCIMKHQISMLQQGIHTLVGNQKDPAVLQRWIEMSRGDFDAIIDDGSHLNADIMNTFNALWPHLNPGGTYFMEDLQVGRAIPYENTKGERVPSDVLQAWLEQLVLPDLLTPKGLNNKPRASLGQRAYLSAWRSGNRTLANRNAREARERHPVPADVAFVFCHARPRAARLARSFASQSSPCREQPCRPQSAPRAMQIGIRSTVAPQGQGQDWEISLAAQATPGAILGTAALPRTPQPLTPSLPSNQDKQATRQQSSTA